MKNLRKYGKEPFHVVVIHGGPGLPGSMAPVARELSSDWGVLEPLQTVATLEGQIDELKEILQKNGEPPFTLIGYSWGAMLAFIFSARHPDLIKKVILIGSAVFEEKYAVSIMKTRLDRLSQEESCEVVSLMNDMNNRSIHDQNTLFTRVGKILTKADSYNPLTLDVEVIEHQYELFQSVWKDATELRISGKLLELGEKIRCPVLAIHGDYDPHPSQGVKKPLSSILYDFQFILLNHCGHIPWIEKEARETFFKILKAQLNRPILNK